MMDLDYLLQRIQDRASDETTATSIAATLSAVPMEGAKPALKRLSVAGELTYTLSSCG